MQFNTYQKIAHAVFVAMLVYWLVMYFAGIKGGLPGDLFDLFYGLIAVYAGSVAIKSIKKWGGTSNNIGRAVWFIGTGLFFWGGGGIVWAYYNIFLGVELPYPSFADLLYVPSLFFYALGVIFLSKTTGAQIGIKSIAGKLFTILVPLIAFVLSYYVFIVVGLGGAKALLEENGLLKTILDIGYPLGDFVSFTIALVVSGLSFKYIGGKYKVDILTIFAGLGMMFMADMLYTFLTNGGMTYNGDIDDLLYLVAASLLSIGILGFATVKNQPETVPSVAHEPQAKPA